MCSHGKLSHGNGRCEVLTCRCVVFVRPPRQKKPSTCLALYRRFTTEKERDAIQAYYAAWPELATERARAEHVLIVGIVHTVEKNERFGPVKPHVVPEVNPDVPPIDTPAWDRGTP